MELPRYSGQRCLKLPRCPPAWLTEFRDKSPGVHAMTHLTASSKTVLDVAIVGGGVSGLYSGWRLLTTPSPDQPQTVSLFEGSDRVGGRLLSVTPPGMPEARIELGGMRFTTWQQLVMSLVPYLKLATEPFRSEEHT